MRYVIIGNSAAAIGAVEGIRRVDQKGSVTIISDEPYHTYSRPLISYYLANQVTEYQMRYRPDNFYEENDVKVLLGRKVLKINPIAKAVVTGKGNVPYDKLLIATGGRPIIPEIIGLDKKGVHTFIKYDDVKSISKEAASGKKAVVVGAGLIGMKAAEALSKLGLQTTVVELSDRILSSILDVKAAQMYKDFLESKGITIQLNNTVTEVRGEDRVASVILQDGTEISCDLLVIAIGVIPNLEVVEDTSISCNRGIIVDHKLQTSIDDIYAAGDVSEGYDLLYGEKRVLPILPNAYMQGEIAGQVMAGGNAEFKGGFAFNSIELFGLAVNTAGIVNPEGEIFESLIEENPDQRYYRKVVLNNDRVVGYIMVKGIDRSGILTSLILERTDISKMKQYLLKEDFGFAYFQPEDRRARLTGGEEIAENN